MKLAIFFSIRMRGYLNHYLRLCGFLKKNPHCEVTWFDLDKPQRGSRYSFSKFDKWVLLGNEDSLEPSHQQWLAQYQVVPESFPLSEALDAKKNKFSFSEKGMVFVPESQSPRQSNFRLWKELNKKIPTLYWCSDEASLESGAPPGVSTLFSPIYPEVQWNALVNATVVVSRSWEPCLVAHTNGVCAIKLNDCQTEGNAWGIPELNIKEKSESEIAQACAELTPPFLASEPAHQQPDDTGSPKSFHLTSISDFSYLPFLVGMIENIFDQKGELPGIHVLALDEKVRPFLKKRYGARVEVYEMAELWKPEELEIISKRPIGFRAFSSKPRLLEKVLQLTQAATFHCDSDVFFFGPSADLLGTFQGGNVVLFPHWNDEFPKSRADGLYNAGMIGVRPGSEKFLRWWTEQCLKKCTFDPDHGFVGDQAYLDFAPILFEGVTIYKKKDHNIARWNLKTLGIEFSEKRERLQNNENHFVKTFHAAFIDSFGFFEFKYCWDQVASFFSGFFEEGKSPEFCKNTLVQQQRYWLTLSRILKLQKMLGSARKAALREPSFFWMHGWGREGLAWPLKLKGILGTLFFLSSTR